MTERDLLPIPARAIEAAAKVLWGDRWQSPMHRALGLDLRRVQRIAAAAREDQTYTLPRGLLADLLAQLERHTRPARSAYEALKQLYDQA